MAIITEVIEISHAPKKFEVVAAEEGKEVGRIYAEFDLDGILQTGFLFVNSLYRRRGVGTQIARQMREAVGPQVTLESRILHVPTLQMLQEMSYLQKALVSKKEIVPPSDMAVLPLGILFQNAGWQLDRVEITPTHIVTSDMTFDDILARIGSEPTGLSAYFTADLFARTDSHS